MGELLVRTYHESQGKPIYVVQERRKEPASARQAPALRVEPRPLPDRVVPSRPGRGREAHSRARRGARGRGHSRPRCVTRRADGVVAAEETVDGVRVVRVAPAGPGRTRQVRMVPRRPASALARARDLRRSRGAGDARPRPARAPRGPALGQGRGAPGRDQRRDVGRGLLPGERASRGGLVRLARAPRRRLPQPPAARRRRLRRHVARHPRRVRGGGRGPASGSHLMPHGVDTARFRPAEPAEERRALRADLGLAPERRIVCYTGRLLRGRGSRPCSRRSRDVAGDEPRAHLVLVGSGAGPGPLGGGRACAHAAGSRAFAAGSSSRAGSRTSRTTCAPPTSSCSPRTSRPSGSR